MRVLIVTKIFPNQRHPGWAPFNRQQFAALGQLPGVEVVDVLATLPWFPGVHLLKGRSLAADLHGVPRREVISGLPVRHPRTLYLPRVGHGLSGGLYLASLLPIALGYRGRVDVILAAWAYPDGCAAIALSRLLGVPVAVKLHGSGINALRELPGPRFFLRTVLPAADRVIAVSAALAERAITLGVPRDRLDVVRNGVDGAVFFPQDAAAARRRVGLPERPTVVCVSRLEREKGVLDLLAAFPAVRAAHPRAQLALVGGGAAAAAVRAQVTALGLDADGAVHLPGAVPLSDVPSWMAAADVMVMPSWAEGLPNTVLEAHACGRPVVSTDVGGVKEVLDQPFLGRLVPPRDPARLGEALCAALGARWDAGQIATARRRTWEDSAAALRLSLESAQVRKQSALAAAGGASI